jgi:GAF domain-containing protein
MDSARSDVFHELLLTLAAAVDIRDVFQRLSTIASRILPHDEANLALFTDDPSRLTMMASSDGGTARQLQPHGDCVLHDTDTARIVADPGGRLCGFQTAIVVPVRAADHQLGVLTWLSRTAGAYADADVPTAQRIADYVAIAISRQRLVESAQRDAVDRERAANVEASSELLREISQALDIRSADAVVQRRWRTRGAAGVFRRRTAGIAVRGPRRSGRKSARQQLRDR